MCPVFILPPTHLTYNIQNIPCTHTETGVSSHVSPSPWSQIFRVGRRRLQLPLDPGSPNVNPRVHRKSSHIIVNRVPTTSLAFYPSFILRLFSLPSLRFPISLAPTHVHTIHRGAILSRFVYCRNHAYALPLLFAYSLILSFPVAPFVHLSNSRLVCYAHSLP